jgi:probable DNA metabolism protein
LADLFHVADDRAADVHVANAPFGDVIYQYDDSFEGLLTAVFESYTRKPAPVGIVGQQHQKRLDAQYVSIETDEAKAERVINGINRSMGGDAYDRVWTGFLSCNPDKGDIIYKYLRFGMKVGHKVHLHLTDQRVMDMDKLTKLVGRESGLLTEFVRFSRMEGGVFYGKIEPDNDVIPLMMPFFADRFNSQPFLIHDTRRQIAGVYDTREWVICSAEGLTMPDYAADELQYRALWKRYYTTIAIKERINPNLRRQHMPKKFWKNITEMSMLDDAPPTALPSDLSRAKSSELYGARKRLKE